MSAIGITDHPAPQSGIWSTRDPLLACTLGSLDFPTRNTLPIAIVYNANRLVAVTKKGISDVGGIPDLAEVEIAFVYEIKSEAFGRLTCSMVAAAHALAKLRHKSQVGTLDAGERAEMEALAEKTKRILPQGLQFVVQTLYDHISNWNVLCDCIQELNQNPFLKFSRSLARKGVAVTLNPLETETTTMRRSEKLFRDAA
jgi:hypothetical protein